jgi:GTP pyrophosphokinase
MLRFNPERVIEADWGSTPNAAVYAVDIVAECIERAGLLRDIMEVLTHASINVTAANTLSQHGSVRLNFTMEVSGIKQLPHVLQLINKVPSVRNVRRA